MEFRLEHKAACAIQHNTKEAAEVEVDLAR